MSFGTGSAASAPRGAEPRAAAAHPAGGSARELQPTASPGARFRCQEKCKCGTASHCPAREATAGSDFYKTRVLITEKRFPERYRSPKGKCWGRHYFPSHLLDLEARMAATWETPVIIDLRTLISTAALSPLSSHCIFSIYMSAACYQNHRLYYFFFLMLQEHAGALPKIRFIAVTNCTEMDEVCVYPGRTNRQPGRKEREQRQA